MHTVHKTSSSRALEGEREVGVGQRRAGMNGPSDQRKPCGCQELAGGHLQAPWAPGSERSGEILELNTPLTGTGFHRDVRTQSFSSPQDLPGKGWRIFSEQILNKGKWL